MSSVLPLPGARTDAELVDDARRLVPHGLRELRIHQALALPPVARVHAAARTAIQDLAGTRMRIGQIHDLEDLRCNRLKRAAFTIRSDLDPGVS